MQKLIILRGVPGSGKSTLARLLQGKMHNCVIVSADMFMTNARGQYFFNPSRLKECHDRSKEAAETALRLGKSVIVDNTNIKLFEMRDYVKMSLMINSHIPIEILKVEGNFKSIHGVPVDKVESMKSAFEVYNSLKDILASKAPWEV